MDKEDHLKRYYSIGEVAEMFEVSKSLIRFWENEFEVLKPHKNSKGDRRFTRQNIEQFQTIYYLVKERGFTLEGAKKELKRLKRSQKERIQMIKHLSNLKSFLEEIKGKLS